MAKASPKQRPMKSRRSGIKNNKRIEANNLILKKYK
jgi:hypothetical protein